MRTLKVKCPTWQHVETFYERKLRKDNTLTLRVPFHTEEGQQVTLGLQLPNDMVMSIEGTVIGLVPGEPGQRDAARLFLHGMTEALVTQLKTMVSDGTHGRAASRQPTVRPDDQPPGQMPDQAPDQPVARPAARTARQPPAPPAPPPTPPRAQPGAAPGTGRAARTTGPQEPARPASEPPVTMPADAPVDEVVEPPFEPSIQDVSEYEREVFLYLDAELVRLRECAAHQVLGVDADADVAQVREAYFALTKRFHPDVYARYRSRALLSMAQELFIHINKAYDRMRDALVLAGRAIVAGPALLPHDGWLAGLDDMMSSDEPAPAKPASQARRKRPSMGAEAADIEEEVLVLLEAGNFEAARERVAGALHFDPRNRHMRALYHVISGRERLATGETMAAATQFEAALAHDRDCRHAREALDELHARGQHSGVFPRSLR